MATDFLRQFSKHFTNFTKSQQKEFERALVENQTSKEITSLETSLELLGRKVDQRLPIPILTVNESIRGASVEWDPLSDQRIMFYEIDVSQSSNFATFDTFTTFGVAFILDGLTNTTFVRVRGVRRDETTTPYSETAVITPVLFDITSHTDEDFYVKIIGTNEQTVLGGPGTALAYTPINPSGNSMVWGFVSMYADPNIGLLGTDMITASVVIKVLDVNDLTVAEAVEWQNTFGEHYSSHAIGPFIVNHPELNQKLEIRLDVRDNNKKTDGTVRGGDRTEILWAHLNVLELGI